MSLFVITEDIYARFTFKLVRTLSFLSLRLKNQRIKNFKRQSLPDFVDKNDR